MFRKTIGVLTLAVLVAPPALAGGREPEILPRTGKWEVNYDKDSCHLFGRFGEGDKAIVALFTRYQPGESFDLTLYGKRLPEMDPDARMEVGIDFGLSGGRMRREAMLGHLGKMPLLMFSSLRLDGWKGDPRNPARETGPVLGPEQEAAVSGATFEVPGRRAFRLEMGSLGKPMELMRACQVDLIRHWGYDPEVQARLSRPATPKFSPASWLQGEDYPNRALDAGNNGIVQFRLDIDAAGKVASCVTLFRTNPDVFGDATCKAITRRARFEPALDADGKPVRSFYINKVRWLMSS